MAIYRGTGSTGTGGESDFAQLAQDAEDAAAAALVSENNAELAETNAETAASQAESHAYLASLSESQAASSATSASGSASTATTQATNAANSATAAATSASNASTSATNAANSATSASTSASTATTQATNAANSATAAASSASAALTSSTNAASSASTATTQATNASNSASAAATSATNASNSASAASTSATNAANSATSASTSATNAAASAAAAAATVTSKVSKSGDTMTGPLIVGVNTSTDALRITQVGAGNALVVEDSANPDATPFVVDSAGNVGIGTSLPSAYGAQFVLASSSANNPTLVSRNAVNDASSSSWFFDKERAGAIVQSNDSLAKIRFRGFDGAAFPTAASIETYVDGTPGTNDMPGRLVFSTTADGASSPTERMRIDSAGRVGIGGSPAAGFNFNIVQPITGATTTYALINQGTINSGVTSAANIFTSAVATQATAFNIGSVRHFFAFNTSIGAGSSVTNQYGFFAESTLTGATNNYGFYSNIAAGTGRYNFYAAGSATNYFAGDIEAGYIYARKSVATPAGGTAAYLMGASNVGIYFGSGAPTVSANKGSLYLRTDGSTTNDRMYVNTNGGTTWTAVITAA